MVRAVSHLQQDESLLRERDSRVRDPRALARAQQAFLEAWYRVLFAPCTTTVRCPAGAAFFCGVGGHLRCRHKSTFPAPTLAAGESLLFNATGLSRGHAFING